MNLGIGESAVKIQAVDPVEDNEKEGTPCPKCGKRIVWTRFCIHCGYDTQPPKPVSVTQQLVVTVLALIVLAFGSCTVIYLSPMLFR